METSTPTSPLSLSEDDKAACLSALESLNQARLEGDDSAITQATREMNTPLDIYLDAIKFAGQVAVDVS